MVFQKSFTHILHQTLKLALVLNLSVHRGTTRKDLSVSAPSSVGEREDWFHTLSRAIADHAAGLCTFGGPCSEVRGWFLNQAFMT